MSRLRSVRAAINYIAWRGSILLALVVILGLAVLKNLHDFGLLRENPSSFLWRGLLGN
jgi:hypothetical protein